MLTWLNAQGTHHEIGLTLGQWGADICHKHLIQSSAWRTVLQWRDSPQARTMRAHVEQAFPWIMDELSGLARGLELALDDVFLWNCRGDIWALAPDGCTTVLAPMRLSHNEDGDPGFAGHCGLVETHPMHAPAFVSFVYPGSIPGHTFAVNASGLAMTVNNIRARAAMTGIPRMVLTRAILALETPAQAVELLRAHPRAGAFHLGIGRAGTSSTHSVEFTGHCVSTEVVDATLRLHANHAIHAAQADLPQIVTPSSQQRQVSGERMIADGAAALDILADQSDALEPIYRNSPQDTDAENTMATADIDLSGPSPSWTVYSRPGEIQFQLEGIRRL